MRNVLLFALVLLPGAALADISGLVVNVSEGDAFTMLVNGRQVMVRLESIDAPEAKQAYGLRSQQSLTELCADKTAAVMETGRDTRGRTLGWVTCDGVDVNLEQVRRGMAWVYKRYAAHGSPLYKAEAAARGRYLGLWADPRPVAPWEWREAVKKIPRK